jgi:hypothetical protein
MLFVGTDGVQTLYAKDANDSAENISLLKIKVYEVGSLRLNVFHRSFDMNWL